MGGLGPARIDAEQPQWLEPKEAVRWAWDVPQKAKGSAHLCLSCKSEHRWLFWGKYCP